MDTAKYSITKYNGTTKVDEKNCKVTYEYTPDLVETLVNSIKDLTKDMDSIKAICIFGEKDSQKRFVNLEARL
jgi:hypothetical protein